MAATPCAGLVGVLGRQQEEETMTDEGPGAVSSPPETGGESAEPIPFMQQVLDNPFLLLFLGITFPAVFYIIWGVMEITSIPVAQ
jgi:hypothetical protein